MSRAVRRVDTPPPWWTAIGGQYAVSLPGWLITVPLGVPAPLVVVPEGDRGDIAGWLLVGTAGQLAYGAVLLLAWLTWLRPGARPARTGAALTTYVVSGAARGVVIAYTSVGLGLVSRPMLEWRVLSSVFIVVVWSSLITILVDAYMSYRRTKAELTVQLERATALREETNRSVERYRAELVADVRSTVLRTLDEITEHAGADANLTATRLRSFADDVVRPLSHQLQSLPVEPQALVVGTRVRRSRPTRVLADIASGAFVEQPFHPLIATTLVIGTHSAGLLYFLGPISGLLVAAASAAVLLLSIAAMRLLLGPLVRRLGGLSGGLLAVAGWVVAALAQAWVVALSGATLIPLVSGVAVNLQAQLAAAVAVAVVRRWQTSQTSLRDAVAVADWQAALLRQRAWSERRAFGRLMHGQVQARVVSAALALRLGPPERAGTILDTLSAEIGECMDAAVPVADLAEAVAGLRDVWAAAIDLDIRVSPPAATACAADPIACRLLAEVMREAVTNAVVHGRAGAVRIVVETDGPELDVEVEDDGRTPPPPEQPVGPPPARSALAPARAGMGTRLLDEATTSWSLTREGARTRLRARIAVVQAAGTPLAGTPAVEAAVREVTST